MIREQQDAMAPVPYESIGEVLKVSRKFVAWMTIAKKEHCFKVVVFHDLSG